MIDLASHLSPPWPALESLVRRDPARRGVASYSSHGSPLCPGHLAAAARDMAERATAVVIVTGFCIVDANLPAAETDGPPSAMFLARALQALDVEVILITDRYGLPSLELGCDRCGLPRSMIREFPLEEAAVVAFDAGCGGEPGCRRADAWVEEFLQSEAGCRLSHLVAIERVGPSHTIRSFLAQRRAGPTPREEFDRDVPPASRDVCHNMRGQPIDLHTARTHRLFEAVAERRLSVTTIGIGDGGNEIGMGTIPWERLRSAINLGPGGRIACRISTDYTLLAGISDWAAYALALAICRLRGRGGLRGRLGRAGPAHARRGSGSRRGRRRRRHRPSRADRRRPAARDVFAGVCRYSRAMSGKPALAELPQARICPAARARLGDEKASTRLSLIQGQLQTQTAPPTAAPPCSPWCAALESPHVVFFRHSNQFSLCWTAQDARGFPGFAQLAARVPGEDAAYIRMDRS